MLQILKGVPKLGCDGPTTSNCTASDHAFSLKVNVDIIFPSLTPWKAYPVTSGITGRRGTVPPETFDREIFAY